MHEPSTTAASQWVDTRMADAVVDIPDETTKAQRLWRSFMIARLSLAFVLVLLHAALYGLDRNQAWIPLLLSLVYMVLCVLVQWLLQPQGQGPQLSRLWLLTIGVDVLAFSLLQTLPSSTINYTPLFALPVVMAAILGTVTLALGTAAAVTLLLFANVGWRSLLDSHNSQALFLQAALTGAGYLVLSFLVSQLAKKLRESELLAERNKRAAEVQRQINALVIESMGDGLLVADERGLVRLTNPAARHLLGYQDNGQPLRLSKGPSWQNLMELLSMSFASQQAQQAEIDLQHAGQGERRLQVKTQLTAVPASGSERLCVMFIQDQRELQARIRTEKMASMGRMSAAVAHEIRNPLSAITQANALLTEDLHDPSLLRLSQIVQQNAQRMEKIVHDILELTQVAQGRNADGSRLIKLTDLLEATCQEWLSQRQRQDVVQRSLDAASAVWVAFEPEHLRRILVNLLDNAWRHASQDADSIWLRCALVGNSPATTVQVHVWSDGAPLEPSVEKHLFEPFFSSQSRSSGLGLYICRELCERNQASIAFRRSERRRGGSVQTGNDFLISMAVATQASPDKHSPIT